MEEVIVSGIATQPGISFWHPVSGATIASVKQVHSDFRSTAYSSSFFASIHPGSPIIYLCLYGRSSPVYRCTLDIQPTSLCISHDETLLLAGCQDGSIRIWDTSTGTLLCSSKLHFCPIKTLSTSPCGSYLATGGVDSAVIVWNLSSLLSLYGTIDPPHPTCRHSFTSFVAPIASLIFSPSTLPPRLFAASSDGTLAILCPVTGVSLWSFTLPEPCSSMAVDSLETCLAVGTGFGSVSMISLTNVSLNTYPNLVKCQKSHESEVSVVCFAEHSKRLFSGSLDGSIKSWSVNDGQCVSNVDVKGPVSCLFVIPTPSNLIDKSSKEAFVIAPLKRVSTNSSFIGVCSNDDSLSNAIVGDLTGSLVSNCSFDSSCGSQNLLNWETEALKWKQISQNLLSEFVEM
ncbi:hypothetical protein P9112_011979 [Eukaryota sp. TZLM1-RC]